MKEIPKPTMNRPAMNWLARAEVDMTTVPMLMIMPPTNMPARRPKRSLEEGKVGHAGRNEGTWLYAQGPAKKAPTIIPMLYTENITPVAGFCGQPMPN